MREVAKTKVVVVEETDAEMVRLQQKIEKMLEEIKAQQEALRIKMEQAGWLEPKKIPPQS